MTSYGSVSRENGCWAIRCEAHVRARLKRVFPRAPQEAAEILRISDSVENSRELLWFLQRYPMDVEGADELERRAQAHVDQERRVAELLALRQSPEPFELALPPRDYQAFAAAMLEVRGGLLLADDVGLGKSISAICPMTKAENLPAVVVVPAHMPRQWVRYLARFAPTLKTHRIRNGRPYSLVRRPRQQMKDLWDAPPDVIVISYHMLRGWAETLAEVCRYVVFDECQQLRHDGTGIFQAASFLAQRAQRRLGLSATPIYNYGAEFWPVIDTLLPGALGDYYEFIREWCVGSFGKARLQDAEQFGGYLRREGIMLRRTRADVGRELPKVQKIAHEVEADLTALKDVAGDAIALAKVILRHNERFRGERMQAAGEFDALMRQATGVAKAPYVAEFVNILIENGQKVLLFGWHREVYGIWKERLARHRPVFYTGTESAAEKQAAIEAFTQGDSQVLIMSLRSGAGVDGLQHSCATVVFGELDWSPGVHEQCIGRLDRDGQTTPVQAFFLTSEEGSDPIMIDVLGIKQEQIESVRNPGQGLIERVDTGENQLRRLAAEFLQAHGVRLPVAPTVAQLPLEGEPA